MSKDQSYGDALMQGWHSPGGLVTDTASIIMTTEGRTIYASTCLAPALAATTSVLLPVNPTGVDRA